mmetsp:Transcript_23978/g.59424  ORF Transcript_23978/g.59424 Transcript_23978/m.59424 type:complete len:269 (+) Transcript_23978:1081-1887(+)
MGRWGCLCCLRRRRHRRSHGDWGRRCARSRRGGTRRVPSARQGCAYFPARMGFGGRNPVRRGPSRRGIPGCRPAGDAPTTAQRWNVARRVFGPSTALAALWRRCIHRRAAVVRVPPQGAGHGGELTYRVPHPGRAARVRPADRRRRYPCRGAHGTRTGGPRRSGGGGAGAVARMRGGGDVPAPVRPGAAHGSHHHLLCRVDGFPRGESSSSRARRRRGRGEDRRWRVVDIELGCGGVMRDVRGAEGPGGTGDVLRVLQLAGVLCVVLL